MLLPVFPPPPPVDVRLVIHVTSLAAALSRLKIDIPIEDLMKVVLEEEEVKLDTECYPALSKLSLPKAAPDPISMSVPKPKPTESTYTDHGDQFDEERCRRLEPTKEASSPNGIPSLTSPTSALSKVPLPKAAPGHGIETTPIVPKPTDLEQLIERNTECMHHHLKQIERLSMRILMMLQPGHLV